MQKIKTIILGWTETVIFKVVIIDIYKNDRGTKNYTCESIVICAWAGVDKFQYCPNFASCV